MAEIAVSLAINHFIPLLTQGVNFLGGVRNELIDIKHELESIQGFLKEADRRAVAERDDINEGVKIWVKQTREAAFRIEDIIDQYMIYVAQQPRDPGCVALLHKISHMIKTLAPRRRLAYEIQEIKLSVSEIKIRRSRYGFDSVGFEETSTSSTVSQDAKWHDPRRAALYMEETEVIGFEAPRDKLTDWLVKGREERSVISVVGMGGQGKSTLAKKVFDSKEVTGHFEDCRVWIKVSRSYKVKRVLRDMLFKFRYTPLQDIATMDRESLINEVRNYLQQKRYLIVFDDVWNVHFWDDIEFAVIDNKKRSRIFMTTRNMSVVMSCKKSSFVEVHELQPLTEEQSLKLFNKKAFQFVYDGCCPRNLIDISSKIVRKCNGLPLAIVVIGSLLCSKEKNPIEWQKFCGNI
jgi:disease resistance protein RPM1